MVAKAVMVLGGGVNNPSGVDESKEMTAQYDRYVMGPYSVESLRR